jgi:hypothetical protein
MENNAEAQFIAPFRKNHAGKPGVMSGAPIGNNGAKAGGRVGKKIENVESK